MNLRLALLERSMPAPLRRVGLDELTRAAATAFGCRPPQWPSERTEDRLLHFARFTAEQAAAAEEAGRSAAARDELRRGAEELGRRLRRRLGVRTDDEAVRALTVLYRELGIELRCREAGRIEMTACFFSRIYSPAVCRLMSGMDEGIVAGVTGGWGLRFTERITEGAGSCVAALTRPGSCARSS